jgi:hypothetical protein
MSEHFEIEPLDDHDYLVRCREPGGVVGSRFRASPAVLDQLRVPAQDERRVVEETAVFLAERQSVVDLPQMLDLEDVAAAYGDYIEELSTRLNRS